MCAIDVVEVTKTKSTTMTSLNATNDDALEGRRRAAAVAAASPVTLTSPPTRVIVDDVDERRSSDLVGPSRSPSPTPSLSSSSSFSGGGGEGILGNGESDPVISSTTTDHVDKATSRSILGRYILELIVGIVISYLVVCFSLQFPFWLAPWAASQTYHVAYYTYDNSHFDNTFYTYGTDYFLAVSMMYLLLTIPIVPTAAAATTTIIRSRHHQHEETTTNEAENNKVIACTPQQRPALSTVQHAIRSRCLLLCYCISVAAGGLAHQFYTTNDSRNTASFRFLWTICVGTVSAASGFMGPIATELVKIDRERRQIQLTTSSSSWQQLPFFPCWFWIGFAVCSTMYVILGAFSFQRPACDIFIAGITQFPSTFYVMAVFAWGFQTSPIKDDRDRGVVDGIINIHVATWARISGMLGFVLNAPLLPMYPLLVQYTNWSLGSVNTLLHCWLLVAWTLQGISLRHVENAIRTSTTVPAAAAAASSTTANPIMVKKRS